MMTKPISDSAAPVDATIDGAPVAHLKSALRRTMREKRAGLEAVARTAASAVISEKIIELLAPLGATKPVAIYLAKSEEVDVDAVALHLLRTQRHVVVPCHSAVQLTAEPGSGSHEGFAPLRFREPGPENDNSLFDVRPGVFGVREPVDGAENMVPPSTIGAFVLPGLAFDRQGYRLGYGGGWFDKALASCLESCPENIVTRPLLLGVCFDCQLVEAVPREEHDVRMNAVVTESRLIEIP